METEHFVGKVAQKVLIEQNGKYPLCRNAFDKSRGVWDLPGGRLHVDELPLEGVRREIREELGIEVDIVGIVYSEQFVHTSQQSPHLLLFYHAKLQTPGQQFTLQPKKVEDIRWVSREELAQENFFDNISRAIKVFLA